MTSLQFSLFDNQGAVVQNSAEIAWLPVEQLFPHPDNPRLIYREDIIQAIADSVRQNGFQPEYALLVRPFESGYQIISGHTRHKAAQKVGIAKLPCWVKEMDDEAAFMELVLANNQGELSPLELGIHALKYAEKSNKWSLESDGLKGYAKDFGKSPAYITQVRNAASVYREIKLSQLNLILNKSQHLNAIHKVPTQYWQQLTELLVENEWSVKQTEEICKAIKEIDIPEYFHHWLDPEKYIKKTIGEATGGGQVNTPAMIKRWVAEAEKHYQTLDTEKEVEVITEGDKKIIEYWDLRGMFLDELPKLCQGASLPSVKSIGEIVVRLNGLLEGMKDQVRQWENERKGEQARKEAEEKRRLEILAKEQKYSPVGIHGDIMEVQLNFSAFDLVLTDPPYLLSNDGITCRGNEQVKVNKNFEDAAGKAVSPDDWLPICFDALKPGGILVFTCTAHLNITKSFLESFGFEFLNQLVWLKRSAPPRLTPTEHRNITEDIWVARKPGASHFFNYDHLKEKYWKGVQPSNVLEFEQCSGSERLGWHDTQKPLSLWSYLIEAYSEKDGTVLDPFSGSGTTAVAAKKLSRICTWVEKKDDFFIAAQGRIEESPFEWE